MMVLLPYEQMVSTKGDGVVNVVQAALKWSKYLLLQGRLMSKWKSADCKIMTKVFHVYVVMKVL